MFLTSLPNGTTYRADLFELVCDKQDVLGSVANLEVVCDRVQRVILELPFSRQAYILAGLVNLAEGRDPADHQQTLFRKSA